MTEKRQCVSCGAPIKVGATRCEYCGMEYEPDYWAGRLRYVPIHAQRRKLVAQTEVPNELLKIAPDGMAEADWKQHIDQKSFIPEMKKAMEDLKRAILLSGVDDNGTITAYEIDGTARTIQIAVCSLVASRIRGGDGDG